MSGHRANTKHRGVLSRFRRDEAGNTLAIIAAALVPLLAMIGGGVDASRAYMVKSRLQQACDAGVLAGRKQTGRGLYTTEADQQAKAMFAINFPSNYMDVKDLNFVASSNDGGTTVRGTAKVNLPTALMYMFGFKTIPLEVDCAAAQEITNTDVTMVLDTTGSMDFDISDGAGGTTTRIAALRKAIKSFYDVMQTATNATNARTRYAFVPYSQGVNVGELVYDASPSYIHGSSPGDTHTYQTRRPVYRYPLIQEVESVAQLDAYECYSLMSQNQPVPSYWQPSWLNYTTGQNATRTGKDGYTFTFTFNSWGGSTATPNTALRGSAFWKTCQRNAIGKKFTYDRNEPNTVFDHYEYGQFSVPIYDYVRSIKTGTQVQRFSEAGVSLTKWDGCIEEGSTVRGADARYDVTSKSILPAGTTDLNIDLIPTTAPTKWRPAWQEIMKIRLDSSNNLTTAAQSTAGIDMFVACPAKAQLLSKMTKAEFETYANGLFARGSTYHDIGMIWGGRLSSPDGIFKDTVNALAPNNGYVSRNLIFLTDGEPAPHPRAPSPYGVEYHDRRVVTSTSTNENDLFGPLATQHTQRFRAVCESVKAKGIRVWVIAFATSMTADMRECASPNSAFVSTNGAALNDSFVKIANAIAELRIVE